MHAGKVCIAYPSIVMADIIRPRHMREGYMSITMLAATYLFYVSKVRRLTVSCRLLILCGLYCMHI